MDNVQLLPNPIINKKEQELMISLKERYNKLIEPNALYKAGAKAVDKLPHGIKEAGGKVKETISSQELVTQALKYAASGFQLLNEIAAKITVSESQVIKKVNNTIKEGNIESLEEVCFARTYNIAKLVNRYRTADILIATVEGAGTGYFGFTGLVPNLVLSTFLYFRAVQSVAMFYGYDVKNDSAEMEIASSVLMSALNPNQDVVNNELTAAVGKFMIFTETTAVKETAKKSWTAMAQHGGLALLITQIRSLGNVTAKKALETAGKKGIEHSVFNGILEQLAKKATLGNSGKAAPVLGSIFGALFDSAQINKIINYADIFYSKRFIEEKEVRINMLLENRN